MGEPSGKGNKKMVDTGGSLGKIDFTSCQEVFKAMKVGRQEGRKKSGKKPEYKKVDPPIAFGIP
jgi:hypothetical protein